jgi:hypothetical protein
MLSSPAAIADVVSCMLHCGSLMTLCQSTLHAMSEFRCAVLLLRWCVPLCRFVYPDERWLRGSTAAYVALYRACTVGRGESTHSMT